MSTKVKLDMYVFVLASGGTTWSEHKKICGIYMLGWCCIQVEEIQPICFEMFRYIFHFVAYSLCLCYTILIWCTMNSFFTVAVVCITCSLGKSIWRVLRKMRNWIYWEKGYFPHTTFFLVLFSREYTPPLNVGSLPFAMSTRSYENSVIHVMFFEWTSNLSAYRDITHLCQTTVSSR